MGSAAESGLSRREREIMDIVFRHGRVGVMVGQVFGPKLTVVSINLFSHSIKSPRPSRALEHLEPSDGEGGTGGERS